MSNRFSEFKSFRHVITIDIVLSFGKNRDPKLHVIEVEVLLHYCKCYLTLVLKVKTCVSIKVDNADFNLYKSTDFSKLVLTTNSHGTAILF